MKDKKIETFINECSSEEIKNLFVSFLGILDDIKHEHDEIFYKVAKNHPEMIKTLEICDYLDDNKMSWLRKKVLDLGNATKRRVQGQIKIKFSGKY